MQGMKKIICAFLLCVTGSALAADSAIWYDWQGKPVAREAAGKVETLQPSDLVAGKTPLQRVESPISSRKYSRGASQFYDFHSPRYGWMAYDCYGYRSLAPAPRRISTGLRAWYGGSQNYGVTVQTPGFSLYWRR